MDKKTILVVEDHEDMQKIYKDMLKDKYKVLIAGDTKKAREQFKGNKIDLMILDLILPDEMGDTFLVKLKHGDKHQRLKTIVVTVLGDVTDKLRQIDPEVICIPKPFEKEHLIKTIESRLKE